MEKTPEFDNTMLLSAILSGGVIGGAVGLIDRNFERAYWAVPAGMAIGIFLDYQLKKSQNLEHVEIAKEFLKTTWDDSKKLGPETNSYWSTILGSLGAMVVLVMGTYGCKGLVGKFQTAAFLRLPNMLPNLRTGNLPLYIMPKDGMPEPELIVDFPLQDMPRPLDMSDQAGGNPVNAIIAPITMQILAAFSGKNPRRAGNVLAAQIVSQIIMQSGMTERLFELVGQSAEIVRAGIDAVAHDVSTRLIDGLTVRQDQMYLSNERLMLIQNPEGTHAFGLLQNGEQTQVVPAVRAPLDTWNAMQNDLARRLNITPISTSQRSDQSVVFDPIPDLPRAPMSEIFERARIEGVRNLEINRQSVAIRADEDDDDSSVDFIPNQAQLREVEQRVQSDIVTRKLGDLEKLMSSIFMSMMTFPIEKRINFKQQITVLDNQHKQVSQGGSGYYAVLEKSWLETHPESEI
jgi:hypothetical protein